MPAGFVNALDWAYGDGANDDANALNQAAAAAATQHKHLWLPETSAVYAIGSQVTVPAGVDVKGWGTLRAGPGISRSAPVLVIGASGQLNERRKVEIDLDSLAVGSSASWAHQAYVGVRLYNPQSCEVWIKRVRGCTVGLEIVADGGLEAVNNVVNLGLLEDVRFGVKFTGAVRDNVLRLGRWEISAAASAAGAGLERSLWRIDHAGASGNLWISPAAGSVPRGSAAATTKLAYLHTKAPMNRIWSLGDGADLDVPGGDGHLIADGAAAEYNLVQIGRHGGQTLAIRKINGAPSNRNSVITRRAIAENATVIGGVKA